MSEFTLCVVGCHVRGGAQKVVVTADTLPALLSSLQSEVEFTAPTPHEVDAVSLFDEDFAEYLLVKTLKILPAKAKVKVTLKPTAAAATPSSIAAHGSGSASEAATFYSDVCDSVLLPAIQDLTGASAAELSALLSEAYVKDSSNSHNPMVEKLQAAVEKGLNRAHEQEISNRQAAVSPERLGYTSAEVSSPAAPVQPSQPQRLFKEENDVTAAEDDNDDIPAARKSRKAAAPGRKNVPVADSGPAPAAAPAAVARPPPQPPVAVVSDSIVVYCVYSGLTSQRAKAIRVNRLQPSLATLLAVLKDKFKSDLALGYIQEDGSFSEVLCDEDVAAIIAKYPEGVESITLHCWAPASAHSMELAYNSDITSRAVTPSGKSVASMSSYAASTSAMSRKSGKSNATSTKSKKKKKKKASSSTNPMDVSGQCYTEEQLRELFDEIDADDNGWLDKEEMRHLFLTRYDPMGINDAEKQFERFLQQCGCLDDGRVTFDEFAIVMLKLAQW